jgi:hypothetical protein
VLRKPQSSSHPSFKSSLTHPTVPGQPKRNKTRPPPHGSRVRPCAPVPSSSGHSQAVDVLVRHEDALAAFDGAIKNEPDWAGILYIAPIELEERERGVAEFDESP